MSRLKPQTKKSENLKELDKLLWALLVIVITGAIAALGYVITNPVEEDFTEFYILGLEGKAEEYPQALAVGEESRVILGIGNQEHQAMSYKVMITIGETLIKDIAIIALEDGEKWEEEVGFAPQESGENQKVEFKLYKTRELGEENDTQLSLWLGREDLDATITNQSQNEAEYRIEIKVKTRIEEEEEEREETKLHSIGPETLTPGSSWETQVSYLYPDAIWQNAELFLYRDGEPIYKEDALGGYPALHLQVDAK